MQILPGLVVCSTPDRVVTNLGSSRTLYLTSLAVYRIAAFGNRVPKGIADALIEENLSRAASPHPYTPI